MVDDDSDATPTRAVAGQAQSGTPSGADREFGRGGYLLLAGLFVVFFVVPATIYLDVFGVVELPFRFAFLVLPLVPALLLASLAVWVTTA